MNEPFEQLDTLERDLLDLHAADKAGVFRRTRVDRRALLRSPRSRQTSFSFFKSYRLLVPIAACFVMAVGVWSIMFHTEVAPVNGGASLVANNSGGGSLGGGIQACVGGPGSMEDPSCSAYDYDSDGDVDLMDFSRHQMVAAMAGGR
jgi:hypothetical protein